MFIVLMVFAVAALALVPLARRLKARVFWIAALVPLGRSCTRCCRHRSRSRRRQAGSR